MAARYTIQKMQTHMKGAIQRAQLFHYREALNPALFNGTKTYRAFLAAHGKINRPALANLN